MNGHRTIVVHSNGGNKLKRTCIDEVHERRLGGVGKNGNSDAMCVKRMKKEGHVLLMTLIV